MKVIVIDGKDRTTLSCRGVIICSDAGHPVGAAIHQKSDVIFCGPADTKEFIEILQQLGIYHLPQYIIRSIKDGN